MGQYEVIEAMRGAGWLTTQQIAERTNRGLTTTGRVLRSLMRWKTVELFESNESGRRWYWRLKDEDS